VTFVRSALTDHILSALALSGLLVGDHSAPPQGGWSKGMPNVGEFAAYSVLSSGAVTITPSALRTGKFDHSAAYTIRSYGGVRSQADDIAAMVRDMVQQIVVPFSFGGHKARLFWCSGIGPVDRMDDQHPKYWRESDSFRVECFAL